MAPFILPLLDIGGKLIEKLFPDPEQAAKAKLDLVRLQQDGQLKELETRMSAILAEAQSADPWTSRARPSFLYVVYIIILASLPMGVLYAISPSTAGDIATGFKEWLAAIPEPMWTLFGAGYLGYVTGRSYDKKQVISLRKGDQ